jgi:hypothetical protein
MTERTGFELIPVPAKVVAAFAFLVGAAFFYKVFDDARPLGWGVAMGAGIGIFLAAFVLLTGYVYGDAARRGMPPFPWAALAFLVPNGVGFIIYFLLRKPILRPCPNCGTGAPPEAAYCSKCGQGL